MNHGGKRDGSGAKQKPAEDRKVKMSISIDKDAKTWLDEQEEKPSPKINDLINAERSYWAMHRAIKESEDEK